MIQQTSSLSEGECLHPPVAVVASRKVKKRKPFRISQFVLSGSRGANYLTSDTETGPSEEQLTTSKSSEQCHVTRNKSEVKPPSSLNSRQTSRVVTQEAGSLSEGGCQPPPSQKVKKCKPFRISRFLSKSRGAKHLASDAESQPSEDPLTTSLSSGQSHVIAGGKSKKKRPFSLKDLAGDARDHSKKCGNNDGTQDGVLSMGSNKSSLKKDDVKRRRTNLSLSQGCLKGDQVTSSRHLNKEKKGPGACSSPKLRVTSRTVTPEASVASLSTGECTNRVDETPALNGHPQTPNLSHKIKKVKDLRVPTVSLAKAKLKCHVSLKAYSRRSKSNKHQKQEDPCDYQRSALVFSTAVETLDTEVSGILTTATAGNTIGKDDCLKAKKRVRFQHPLASACSQSEDNVTCATQTNYGDTTKRSRLSQGQSLEFKTELVSPDCDGIVSLSAGGSCDAGEAKELAGLLLKSTPDLNHSLSCRQKSHVSPNLIMDPQASGVVTRSNLDLTGEPKDVRQSPGTTSQDQRSNDTPCSPNSGLPNIPECVKHRKRSFADLGNSHEPSIRMKQSFAEGVCTEQNGGLRLSEIGVHTLPCDVQADPATMPSEGNSSGKERQSPVTFTNLVYSQGLQVCPLSSRMVELEAPKEAVEDSGKTIANQHRVSMGSSNPCANHSDPIASPVPASASTATAEFDNSIVGIAMQLAAELVAYPVPQLAAALACHVVAYETNVPVDTLTQHTESIITVAKKACRVSDLKKHPAKAVGVPANVFSSSAIADTVCSQLDAVSGSASVVSKNPLCGLVMSKESAAAEDAALDEMEPRNTQAVSSQPKPGDLSARTSSSKAGSIAQRGSIDHSLERKLSAARSKPHGSAPGIKKSSPTSSKTAFQAAPGRTESSLSVQRTVSPSRSTAHPTLAKKITILDVTKNRAPHPTTPREIRSSAAVGKVSAAGKPEKDVASSSNHLLHTVREEGSNVADGAAIPRDTAGPRTPARAAKGGARATARLTKAATSLNDAASASRTTSDSAQSSAPRRLTPGGHQLITPPKKSVFSRLSLLKSDPTPAMGSGGSCVEDEDFDSWEADADAERYNDSTGFCTVCGSSVDFEEECVECNPRRPFSRLGSLELGGSS